MENEDENHTNSFATKSTRNDDHSDDEMNIGEEDDDDNDADWNSWWI
jgi:hypothetical protein